MLLTPTPNEPVENWLLRGLYVRILSYFYTQNYYSRDIAQAMDIPQSVIKPMVRELRLYGLIKYQYGNLDEDGATYGAGHRITESGREYYRKMREEYGDNPSRTTKS